MLFEVYLKVPNSPLKSWDIEKKKRDPPETFHMFNSQRDVYSKRCYGEIVQITSQVS